MRTRPSNRARLNTESLEDRTTPANVIPVDTTDDVTDGDTSSIANLLATPGPDGAISLREAITAVNNTTTDQSNQINVPAGNINLKSQLTITKDVTITGPGDQLTISGDWGFNGGNPGDGWRVFNIGASAVVEIRKLKIYGGGATSASDANGGGIKVDSNALLTLRQCTVESCNANGDGGGIWVDSGGKLEVLGSTVSSCLAQGNGGGVAVNNGARVTVNQDVTCGFNSLIQLNTAKKDGGGLWLTGSGNVSQAGIFSINRTTIDQNTADGSVAGGNGGGLYVKWTGNTTGINPVEITQTDFTDNKARYGFGGGVYVAAGIKFGAGVAVHDSQSGQARGVGIYDPSSQAVGVDGVDQQGSRTVPPGGGGVQNPDPGPPSAIYIGDGAVATLSGTVMDEEGGDLGDGSTPATNFVNAGTLIPSGFGGAGDIGTISMTGSYTQVSTGALNLDLGGDGQNPPAAGTDYDQLAVSGASNLVSLAGALALNPVWSAPPAVGTKFIIISNDTAAATSGTFDGLPDGTIIAVAGVGLQITYNRPSTDGNGDPQDPNDVVLEVVPAVISGFVWDDGWDYSSGGTWDEDGVTYTPAGPGPGVAGVVVHLLDAAGVEVDWTTTDAGGYYRFSVAVAGQYRVKVDLPPNTDTDTYAFTAESQGGDPDADSDVDASGYTDWFVLDAGGFVDRDAGIIDHILYS